MDVNMDENNNINNDVNNININYDINNNTNRSYAYGGNVIYSHAKIKEQLKYKELKNIYSENILDSILKGNIYSYSVYFNYYKQSIINNYRNKYYLYLESVNKKIKSLYALKNTILIQDIQELIIEKLRNKL